MTARLIMAFAILTIVAGMLFGVYRLGARSVRAEWDRERATTAELQASDEREIRRAIDTIFINSRKEQARAQATINSLRADVRAGAERLSVAVDSCTPGDAGAADREARADILPASADRIIEIIGEADDAVRDLNACVDAYNSVREGRHVQAR